MTTQKYYQNNKKEINRKTNIYRVWARKFGMDWLFLQLGNKCLFCDKNPQQVKMEIDHPLGAWEFHYHQIDGVRIRSAVQLQTEDLIRQFEEGEPLRLLCIQCHRVSHGFRV